MRDWRDAGAKDHFVQFYRTDSYLIECLAGYVTEGLWRDNHVIVIATPEHRVALEERIRQKGIDVLSCVVNGRYLSLDAREVLSKFMVNGRPDREAFFRVVGGLVSHNATGSRGLRAFGEMVALLWGEGNRVAAIELEQLWNDLGREHEFSLFCAYPADLGVAKPNEPAFEHICHTHHCVISLAGVN